MQRILTEAEVGRMLKACRSGRDRALVLMLVSTGARIGEALGVTAADFDGDAMGVRLETLKNRSFGRRLVRIDPQVMAELLREAARNGGRVLPYTAQAAWARVRRIALRADLGYDVHPHTFRHTFAALLLRKGAPLHEVQAALGHAGPAMTLAYARLTGALTNREVIRIEEAA